MTRAKETKKKEQKRKELIKRRKRERARSSYTQKSRFNRDSIESLGIDLSRGTRRCFYTPNKLL